MTEQQAGWFPDPSGNVTKLRYWDGTQWTEHYSETEAVHPEAQALPVQAKRNKKALLFILIGVGVLVVIGVILAIVLVQCNSNDTSNSLNNSNPNTNPSTITAPQIQDSSGDIIVQIGAVYSTSQFDFMVNSLYISANYYSTTAASGNNLVIANIAITNITNTAQPYGTSDWFLIDESLHDGILPLDPPMGANSMMMPLYAMLSPGETRTYDVVIEYPANLANPYIVTFDKGSNWDDAVAFKIPIK